MNNGLLIVVSGPSGSGKGSIIKKYLKKNKGVVLSVSATTRAPRKGEIDGCHYHFKTIDEFKKMIESDELIEWVEYCGNYYGTLKQWVQDQLSDGKDVLLEIEVEGAMNIKKMFPESILVFVLPPGFAELRKRMEKRGTETSKVLDNRLERAAEELGYAKEYGYLLLNEDLDIAVTDMDIIIKAEKLKINRNLGVITQFEKQLKGVTMKND
jgi:guanylate kinase